MANLSNEPLSMRLDQAHTLSLHQMLAVLWIQTHSWFLFLGKYATGFHVVSFPDRTVGDVLKIVAAEANTNVFVNNNQIGSIASAGGFMEYQLG